jgi:hypothetical protein
MIKKISTPIIYILLAICMLALTLSFNSCVESGIKYYTPIEYSEGSDYRAFVTIEEGAPYFSFEYPSYYGLSDQTAPGNPFLYVVLNGILLENFYKGKVKTIKICITNVSQELLVFPDAETAVNSYVSERKWSFYRNYRLREKHKAVVGGIEGWETVITYRERPLPVGELGKPRDPAFIVRRDVFLDFQGMTWQISLITDTDSYEQQTKTDFEHILQTFKFHE